MTDVIEQAEKHNWWYSDTSPATNLIHEIKELRALLVELRRAGGWVRERIDTARPDLASLDTQLEG